MSLESTTALLRSRLGTDSGLGATVKFDFGAEGVIYLDGAADPNSVSNDDADAECTVQISLEDFQGGRENRRTTGSVIGAKSRVWIGGADQVSSEYRLASIANGDRIHVG